jgi:6-phosphogluconolactonase (cycloisomerase 2 family)
MVDRPPNTAPEGNAIMPGKTVLYAAVGPDITQYDMDVASGTLTARGTVSAPAKVQYVWPHASKKFLYVASTDSGSGMSGGGTNHHVTAWRIDPASGALTQHGAAIPLPSRPIHMSTDVPSEHVLVAFNNPPQVCVYRINPDGTAGAEVPQPHTIDPGIFPHQVLPTPDGKQVILVARGFDADARKPEQPGALQVFDYKDGVLSNQVSIAPNGGFGFGPRHLDFHPTKPWIYVSLERQDQIAFFTHDNGRLSPDALVRADALKPGAQVGSRQLVGTVHVHPNGRFAYVANRASETVESGGRKVFEGGQNSIAVYAIDPASGAPSVIQHAETHGIHPRTFHIDPSGKLMVIAHIMGLPLADGTTVPTRLTTHRIGDDGKLTFLRAYDIETNGQLMWWAGMVELP